MASTQSDSPLQLGSLNCWHSKKECAVAYQILRIDVEQLKAVQHTGYDGCTNELTSHTSVKQSLLKIQNLQVDLDQEAKCKYIPKTMEGSGCIRYSKQSRRAKQSVANILAEVLPGP